MSRETFRITLDKFTVRLGEHDQLIFSEKQLRGECPPMHEGALRPSEKLKLRRRRQARGLTTIQADGTNILGDTL